MLRGFVAIFLLLVATGSAGVYRWHEDSKAAGAAAAQPSYKTPQEANVFVRFDMEVFDIIEREYWQKTAEADLVELFRLSLAKAEGTTTNEILPSRDRAGIC